MPQRNASKGKAETLHWRDIQVPVLSPILEAALDAFYETGFHGTSVRDVARRVGLTIPSLYYHYDSKEGLLLAVLTQSLEPIAQRVELAAQDGETAAQRLAHVIEALVLSAVENIRAVAIDSSEGRYLNEENHVRYRALRSRIETVVRALIDEGVASGEFSVLDVPEVVRAMLGMLQAIPRWYHREGRDSPRKIGVRYADLALRMVGYQKVMAAVSKSVSHARLSKSVRR